MLLKVLVQVVVMQVQRDRNEFWYFTLHEN